MPSSKSSTIPDPELVAAIVAVLMSSDEAYQAALEHSSDPAAAYCAALRAVLAASRSKRLELEAAVRRQLIRTCCEVAQIAACEATGASEVPVRPRIRRH